LPAKPNTSVSEEQLAEFQSTFKKFDRDGSGTLEKLEFKACLQALGHNVGDDIALENVMKQIAKEHEGKKITFNEFVNYMVLKTEDADTPATIKEAFKTIAGNRNYVTEEELRKVLDKETVDYLLSRMPNNKGQYDFNAFTDQNYLEK